MHYIYSFSEFCCHRKCLSVTLDKADLQCFLSVIRDRYIAFMREHAANVQKIFKVMNAGNLKDCLEKVC